MPLPGKHNLSHLPPLFRSHILLFLIVVCLIYSPTALHSSDRIAFSIDVEAVLAKAGCNTGACHGNLNGKGGFTLSLRGQDPDFDFRSLVRASASRRVNRLVPEESLLLLKPTGAIAHQGGQRFLPDSYEYKTLRSWIQQGTHFLPENPLYVSHLEVKPLDVVVHDADSLQISATAVFSDNSRRDISSLAVYEPSNLLVSVNQAGRVSRQAYGESIVIVRFLDQQVPLRIAFTPPRDNFLWQDPPKNNFIDVLNFQKLHKLGINPSSTSLDHVFLRRVFLDLLGVLPTSQESQNFNANNRPDKREQVIDQILARPEFADFWALKWADILRNEEKTLDHKGVEVFHAWIRENIATAKPIDRFVRELLTTEGSTYKKPATNYFRANRTPLIRGETTARLFLGARLQCAKCHNHPFDRWTQDDYYRWAELFALVDYELIDNERRDDFDKNEFVGEQLIRTNGNLLVRNPRTGKHAKPKLLGGPEILPGAHYDRLKTLAVWLTSADNHSFSRAQVNFIWYHVLGQGLVEPIDDLRPTNPSTNPALFATLSHKFVQSGFDLRALVRTIVSSKTYQLASQPNPSNREDLSNLSRARVQRIPAEVLLDAQSKVLDVPAQFLGYPSGTRALQIPGVRKVRLRDTFPAAGDRFLATFGKPERILACTCERSNETTLKQAFVLIGDQGLNSQLENRENRIYRLANSEQGDEQCIDELYWTALNRAPTSEEIAGAATLLSSTDGVEGRFLALQDLAWALLNSKEFIFRY